MQDLHRFRSIGDRVWLWYNSQVWDEEINGKSIMGLMLLAAEQGRTLELIADGPDEDEMLDALVDLIEVKKFNEE